MGRTAVWCMVVAVLAASCVGGDEPAQEVTGEAAAGTDLAEVADLDPCGTSDHPCSLADVPEEVAARTDELATELGARFRGTEDVDDALAWLRDHGDVVFAEAGDEAIRFRVRGGRGQWLFFRTAADVMVEIRGKSAGAAAGAPGEVVAAGADTSAGPAPDPMVLAQAADGDSPFKRALLLSPFRWQWQVQGLDDGIEGIRTALDARDYVDGVDVVVDAMVPDSSPPRMAGGGLGLSSFTSWDDYDYVHLLTHGGAIRVEGRTLTVVMTPWTKQLVESAQAGAEASGDPDRIAEFSAVGAETARLWIDARASAIPDDIGPGLVKTEFVPLDQQSLPVDQKRPRTEVGNFIVLPSTWFATTYPDGVEDAVVVISACSSAAGDDKDLLRAIVGSQQDTAVAGWSTSMSVEAAAAAGTMLARALVHVDADVEEDSGLTIRAARRRLTDFLRNLSESPPTDRECSFPVSPEIEARCVLSRYGTPLDIINDVPVDAVTGASFEVVGEGSVRAREVVYLVDRDGVELFEGLFGDDRLPVLGMPGDGEPDELMATVRVDGLADDEDPRDVQLRVAVDGREQDVAKVLDREVGDGVWEVDARLPLGRDHEPGELLTLEVVAVMPGGLESRWTYEEVALCGVTPGGLPMPFRPPPGAEYVGEAVYPPQGDRWLVPSIHEALAFMRGAVDDEPDHGALGDYEAALVGDNELVSIGVAGPCFGFGGALMFSDYDDQPSSMVVFDLEERPYAEIIARTAP